VAPDVRPRLPEEPHELLPRVHASAAAAAGMANAAAPDAVRTPARRGQTQAPAPGGCIPRRRPRYPAGEARGGDRWGHVRKWGKDTAYEP
jgi:hypothetical protein